MARRSRRRRSSPSKANPRSYSGLRARGEHEQESISSAQSSAEPVVSDHAAQPAPASKGPSQANWKTEYSRVFFRPETTVDRLGRVVCVDASGRLLLVMAGSRPGKESYAAG